MYDINFYMNTYDLNYALSKGKKIDKHEVRQLYEKYRSKSPIIYNIETTNACNMVCEMCPRTTRMTRQVKALNRDIIDKVINQISPHSKEDWHKWKEFVVNTYGILENDMSENHFFLYIIPRVIQLHGYGDPLLDKNLHRTVSQLSKKGIDTYFSCNPANINMDRTIQMFESGLSYIKYSIESVNDDRFKKIRGSESNFTESFKNIKELLRLKAERNYKTVIIITMINLNHRDQKEEYTRLVEAFKGLDVYIYLKSEDQQWYRKDYHGTDSVHWSEVCKHLWMSMTVKSDGEVVMCMEDYDNEIVLGNAYDDSLSDIWNGNKYNKFREDHFLLTSKIKCTEECDMNLCGNYTSNLN